MRSYVVVVAKHGRVDPGRLRAAARRALPFRSDGEPAAEWTSRSGQVAVAAWTNEPEQPGRPLLTVDATGAVGYSGTVRAGLPPAARLLGADSAGVEGTWALFGAAEDGIAAATCASGAEVVYHAEGSEYVVAGNRALLVHLVADQRGPTPDLVGLAAVLSQGYCVTARTSLAGVSALPPAHRVVCDAGGRPRVSPWGSPVRDGNAAAADVAEALVASVAPLTGLEHPVRLGLTGGRDSRLIVALLASAGVDVSTYTSGREQDPDVVVAREVAARLGVPHKVTGPMGAKVEESTVTVDVRSRVREAVVLGEGMLSAYDRVGRVDDTYNPRLVPFGGTGGEILRAYYAGMLKDPDDQAEILRTMRGRLRTATKRMTPDLRAAYEQDTEPWLEAARRQGAASLEEFYVRQRTARWSGTARSSASIGSLAQRPYLDHGVVTAVRRVALADRMSERLTVELLDLLAPSLRDVRFAGRRWKFDEQPPEDPAARARWEQRAPVQGAHGDQAALNWRTDLPEVRRELAELVMDAPDSFWQLADRRATEEFLRPLEGRSRGDTMKMWHLATVASALAADFHADEGKFTPTSHQVVAALPTQPAPPPALSWRRAARGAARSVARRVRDRLGG